MRLRVHIINLVICESDAIEKIKNCNRKTTNYEHTISNKYYALRCDINYEHIARVYVLVFEKTFAYLPNELVQFSITKLNNYKIA